MLRIRSFWLASAAIAALMLAMPAAAQQSSPEPDFDLDAPMAPMPELGVEWPDMADAPASPDDTAPAEAVATVDDTGERRYATAIAGLSDQLRTSIDEQFKLLSTLKQGEDDPANIAQIDRRAREDADLLIALLRSKGYYDAVVEPEVATTGDRLTVTLQAEPGPLYTFDKVEVAGLNGTGDKAADLRAAFGVDAQEPVDSAEVITGTVALETQIKSQGYPFAKVGDSDVVIDHDTRTATLALTVDPGGQRRIGRFTVTGDRAPFGPKHVATISRIKSGEIYDQAMIDDLKRALVATGLVSSVKADPVPATDPALADIAVTIDRAPPRTIAGELGYGSGEGARVEASWTHRNLIRPEGAVTLRGVLGTEEQVAGAIFRQSNFRTRDNVLSGRLVASNINRAAFQARTLEIGGGLERTSTIIWQKKWTWSAGFELLASDERDALRVIGGQRRTFFIGALPASLGYDGSDDLLDPTRGFRLSARVTPEASLQSGAFGYLRTQIDGSVYVPAGDRVVIAARGRLGTIVGAANTRIAPSRRLYAGGGGSVRGYGFQNVGPRDAANDPVGGRGLAEASIEARVRFGPFAVVPFIDAGSVTSKSVPSLSDIRFGAGIGGRYHSAFGPIRIDLATPINPRRGDSPIAIYVSLGQAF
jgi:translocation and assembly module TamA